MKLQLDARQFYRVGFWSFFIIALAGFVNLLIRWQGFNPWDKLGTLATLVFEFAMVLFFNYLLKTLPSASGSPTIEENSEVNDILKELDEARNKKPEKAVKSSKTK